MSVVVLFDQFSDNAIRYKGGAGVNDGDQVILARSLAKFNTFLILSTSGSLRVKACLDGVNFSVDPVSLQSLGATDTNPVLATSAGRLFAVRGTFDSLSIEQVGAGAVADACLICSKL